MATITEDYVSDETFKLLKEKGFDDSCCRFVVESNETYHRGAPTLQMAMKELKKIEQKPIELDGNRSKELSLSLQIQAYLNTASDELYAKGKPLYSEKRVEDIHKCMLMWQKLHNAYFYQRPAEWSEDDENLLTDTEYLLRVVKMENRSDNEYQRAENCLSWLKSLNPQNRWKPSDAQMASITCAVRKMKESACYDSELVSLYQDLKKLKE